MAMMSMMGRRAVLTNESVQHAQDVINLLLGDPAALAETRAAVEALDEQMRASRERLSTYRAAWSAEIAAERADLDKQREQLRADQAAFAERVRRFTEAAAL